MQNAIMAGGYPRPQEPAQAPQQEPQQFDFETALQTYAQLVQQMDFNGDGVVDEKDFAILKQRGMAR